MAAYRSPIALHHSCIIYASSLTIALHRVEQLARSFPAKNCSHFLSIALVSCSVKIEDSGSALSLSRALLVAVIYL